MRTVANLLDKKNGKKEEKIIRATVCVVRYIEVGRALVKHSAGKYEPCDAEKERIEDPSSF